jgi:calcium-dependent protein kinase
MAELMKDKGMNDSLAIKALIDFRSKSQLKKEALNVLVKMLDQQTIEPL